MTAGSVSNINNNTVASVSLTGVTSSGTSTSSPMLGILVTNGAANTNNNTIGSQSATGSLVFSTTTTTSTDVLGIYNFSVDNWTSTGNNIGGISFTNAGASGTMVLYCMRANTGTSYTWNATSNNIGGTVSNSIQMNATGASSQVIGFHTTNASSTFTTNTIRNLTSNIGTGTSTSASVIGIVTNTTSTNQIISQNTIYNLYNSNASAATSVIGIQFSGSTANVIERNKIYALTVASNSTSAEVDGIKISGGTNVIRNNMIALGAGITNAIGTGSTYGISGIYELVGTNNMYHNSIYIGGSPTAGAGPSWAFNGQQTVNTRNFRDNVFVNERSNGGTSTGKNYVVRVGGSSPNPTGLTINNNVYYGTGTGFTFGYFNALDVANLGAWKVAVGQDANSFQANPQYLDPTNATPDLHINATVATAIEGNGVDLGVTNDYDGETRSGLTPVDIGADAGIFIGMDMLGPAITYSPLSNTTSTSNRSTASFAAITDVSGVNTSAGTMPRIYYKKSTDANTFNDNTSATAGWKYAESSSGFSPFDFTIDYSLLNSAPVAVGDVIQYFIVAQDLASSPNVSINSGTFAAAPSSVALTAAAFPISGSINSYTIMNSISGIKTVGTGGDYATLTGAAGAFADINAKVVTGNIELQIISDINTETGAIALNQFSEEPAGSNYTIKIYPAGAARAVSGALASGALIKLNGADRVTIDGSLGSGGTDRSLTITNTGTSAASAISLASLGTGLGATGNTIKNCNISTGVNTVISYGIAVGGSTPGTSGADNDNVTIQNNNITVATISIYAAGTSSGSTGGNDNLQITGNTVNSNSTLANIGIQAGNALNSTISQNTVSVQSSIAGTPVGISLETGFVSSVVTRNLITQVLATSSGGYGGRGMTIGTGTASSSLTLSNNVIYGVNGSNYSSFGNSSSMGIVIGTVGASSSLTTTTGGVNLYYNSVNLAGSYTYAAACLTTAVYVGSGASALDIRDNVFVNSLANTSTSYTSKSYAIYSAAANTAFSNINYNDYFVSGTHGVLAYLGSDQTTLANIQTAFGGNANSLAANPQLTSPTDLRPNLGSPIIAAGTPIAGITIDYTGATRSGSIPSMGAYENAVDGQGPVITYTPLGVTCSTENRTLSATISDPSGVPVTGTGLPVLYFRKGVSGTFTAAQGVYSGSGNVYDFVIDHTAVGGVTGGDLIQYYIAAQDNFATPNVSVNPSAGASGLTYNPPAAATPPTTPFSYVIGTTMSGTYTVGTGGNYETLTAAINAINAGCITGSVTLILTNTSYSVSETFPIVINANPYFNSSVTLTIKPYTGTAVTISGSSATALVKLYGADYVTIDGLNTDGSSLTFNNSNASGVDLWMACTPTDGATNNMVQNCSFLGASGGTTIAGVLAGSGTTLGNSAEAANSYNTIQYNTFKSTQNGIYINGFATVPYDVNWVVTHNTFGSTVTAEKHGYRGMLIGNASNFTVSNNSIVGVVSSSSSTSTMSGIQVALAVNGGKVSSNIIGNIAQVNTTGWGANGIYLTCSTTSSSVDIYNNVVYDVSAYGYNGTAQSDNGYGIMLNSGGGYNLYYNSVNMNTSQTLSTGIPAAINISSSITTASSIKLLNNIFNIPASNTVGTRYAIYCGAANSVFSDINYNEYYSAGTLGYLGSAISTIAAWRTATGKDLNSISANPLFTSATNLVPQTGSPVIGVGYPLPGVVDTDINNAARGNSTTLGAYEKVAFITAGGPLTFCEGGSVTLTASAGGSYLWSPGGETTPSIAATATGSYSVTVTTNGNAAASAATVVTASPNYTLTNSIDVSANNICSGTSVDFTCNQNYPVAACNWYVNGLLYYTGMSLTGYIPANGDVVYCICDVDLTYYSCWTSLTAESNHITMVVNSCASKTLDLTVFLEGLYDPNTGMMNQANDDMGPHFGTGIADQVTIELHNDADYTVIEYSSGLVDLTTDGDISISVPNDKSGSYYITIRHRNSIETTSATAVSFAGSAISYDFSTAASQAYGDNQKGVSGVYMFWGGDVNQDGIIDSGDMNPVDNAATAISFGYVPEDVDGSGLVDSSDMNVVDNNSTAIVMAILP